MARKILDSEERWERARKYFNQDVLAILASDLPSGIQSLIVYIQDHFDHIMQRQEEEDVGGGSLYEYEAQLIISVSQLGEKFSYLIIKELLDGLFSGVLSVDRIAEVGAGDLVIDTNNRGEIKRVAKQIPMAQ